MSFSIGFDIGGTKIAAALFDDLHNELAQIVVPTPTVYSDLVTTCVGIVEQFDRKSGARTSVGVGVPGSVNRATGSVPVAANTPSLSGKPLQKDLNNLLERPIGVANDADCAALSEATDGAGAGYQTVFGLIMGTGVGGGFVIDRKIIEGPNGLTGEFGHIPLPFRELEDGPFAECICRQKGCIDKSISGAALSRLYMSVTGGAADATQIAQQALMGDAGALQILDRFYATVAKGLVPIIHMFDPEIIVVSGGLSQLPRLTEEVTKRWGQYTLCKNPKNKLAVAKHGAMTGLRGAAWVGIAAAN